MKKAMTAFVCVFGLLLAFEPGRVYINFIGIALLLFAGSEGVKAVNHEM